MLHLKLYRIIPMITVISAFGMGNVFAQTSNLSDKDIDRGKEIGYVYEAYMSPQQEPGEEQDTPATTPKAFKSTKPSVLRDDRPSKGYGRVSFTNDLSKAYVEVKIEGVNVDEINMFHIHCGRPDQLGPILVDFSMGTEIQTNFKDDGVFTIEINNDLIVAEANSGEGLIGAFTAGCPIIPGTKDKVQTVAGMETIARKGELYFNLHTNGQTYYGDMRGQILQAKPESIAAARESLKNGMKEVPKSTGGHNGHHH